MDNNITEIVFILDKSGSMQGLEKDTVGGFNALLKKQKKEKGRAYITTILFDTTWTMLYDRVELQEMECLKESDFIVGGCTALLDTMGFAIGHIEKIHKYVRAEDIPQKTIFVIMTDGMENSSKKFTQKQIKALVESKQNDNQWEFVFLGANIDAIETATMYGIESESAAEFNTTEDGIGVVYDAIDKYICASRKCYKKVGRGWAKQLDKDMNKKKNKS